MTGVIASRELGHLLRSPLAWLLLGVLQLLLAWLFLLQLEGFVTVQSRLATLDAAPGLTDLVAAPLMGSAATLFLLVAPMLGMGALAGERQGGTLPLLLASPLTPAQIVLGKYLGLFAFLLLATALTLLMPLALLAGGRLDGGKLAAATLGLTLASAAFAAIALWVSSLADTPLTAALGGFGLLLLLWLLGLGGGTNGGMLHWLSLQSHLTPFLQGVVRLSDLVYYLALTAAALLLAIHRLKDL